MRFQCVFNANSTRTNRWAVVYHYFHIIGVNEYLRNSIVFGSSVHLSVCPSVRTSIRGHSNLVIKFECGVSPTNDNRYGRQNGRRLSVCSCGHSHLVIYHPISSKCNIQITLNKRWPELEYTFCPMNINKDGCQNGRRLWLVCTCRHSKLVIYHTVASKFHIRIALIKGSPNLEHGFCPITEMATKIAATYRFALVDILTCRPTSSKFHI